MRHLRLMILAGGIAVLASASTESAAAATATPIPSDSRDPVRSGRKVLPDPDLFDGSNLPPEKQPDFGMLGEFEMPGGDELQERVGGGPGNLPEGGDAAGGAGDEPPQENPSGGGNPVDSGDPNAAPAGIKAEQLIGGQTLAGDAGGAQEKPREIALGDASLKIEQSGSSASVQNITGTTAETGVQRYKKDPAAGQQTNPPNLGAEKGRTMPSGL